MFCTNCGNQIPGGGNVCPYCGKPVAGAGGMGYRRQPVRIDNIFTALVNERTPGAIWEFSLWCVVCVCVILSLAASVSVSSWMGEHSVVFRLTWLSLMFFQIGAGVSMAFRQKAIMLFGVSVTIQCIIPILLFVGYAGAYKEAEDTVPAAMIVLFVFLILAAVGLVTCASIQFFSKLEMGKITAILDVVVAGLTLFFMIGVGASSGFVSSWVISRSGFGPGVTSLIGMNVAVSVFYMLFFFGCIDSRKRKILGGGSLSGGGSYGPNGGRPAFTPGLQCIRGQYQGQVMYLQNGELTFGSDASAAIVIPSPHISHRHCSVRYNPGMGTYEVMDVSTNGVYVTAQNGGTQRIPAGSYVPCARGSVISLGSMEQQFRLL